MGINPRDLRGHVGPHPHHPPAELIGQLEGLQLQIVAGPGQQRIEKFDQRWDHQFVTPAFVKVEQRTAQPFQPTGGWWTTVFHPRYGYSGPEVILCDDAQPAHFANYTPEDAPIWVPRPADGWDLGVRIAADRHADEADQ